MTELFSIAKRLRDIARVFSSDHDPVLVHNIRQGADRIDELEAALRAMVTLFDDEGNMIGSFTEMQKAINDTYDVLSHAEQNRPIGRRLIHKLDENEIWVEELVEFTDHDPIVMHPSDAIET
jgi:hypothetical protein